MFFSFQGDKFPVDLVTQPIANSVDLRHETSQPTAGIISNVTGPGSSRTLIPSQSMEQLMLLGFLYSSFENICFYFYDIFPILVSEPGLLGPPVKHDGSSVDRDYDMRKGLLSMRHGPDIRGQISAEPPLIPRPPNQASPSPMQSIGGGLVEDDIASKTQTNNWPSASVKESNVNVIKSDKHQPQPKPFSHSIIGSSPNVVLPQTSQHRAEEVCR